MIQVNNFDNLDTQIKCAEIIDPKIVDLVRGKNLIYKDKKMVHLAKYNISHRESEYEDPQEEYESDENENYHNEDHDGEEYDDGGNQMDH